MGARAGHMKRRHRQGPHRPIAKSPIAIWPSYDDQAAGHAPEVLAKEHLPLKGGILSRPTLRVRLNYLVQPVLK